MSVEYGIPVALYGGAFQVYSHFAAGHGDKTCCASESYWYKVYHRSRGPEMPGPRGASKGRSWAAAVAGGRGGAAPGEAKACTFTNFRPSSC